MKINNTNGPAETDAKEKLRDKFGKCVDLGIRDCGPDFDMELARHFILAKLVKMNIAGVLDKYVAPILMVPRGPEVGPLTR